jgi:hypothetical protein
MKVLFITMTILGIMTATAKASDTSLVLHYLVREPVVKTAETPVLILLHGVGSNEQDLFSLANRLPDDFLVISARAPSFVQSFASTPEGALVLADYAYSDAMKSTSSPEIDALLEEIRLIRLEMNQLLENTVELTESEVEWLEQKMADLHDLESNLEPLVNLLKLEKLNWTEIFLNQIIDISPSTLFGQYYKTFCLGVCEKTMTGDLSNLHDEILDIAKLCEKEFGTLPAFAGTLLMREERLLAMSISQEDNCMPQTSEKTTSTSFAHITDGEILSWRLFDSYGRLITEGANKFSKLSAQGFIRVTGCYFLQKQTTNGSVTEKVFFTKLN